MKLVYKFLIPTIAILVVGFYLLLDKTLASRDEVVDLLQNSSKKLLIKQLQERQNSQINMQNKFLEFSANSIANISANFIDNYDKDGLEKELLYYFNIDAVKVLAVYDYLNGSHFAVLYKKDGEISSSENLPAIASTYKKIKKEMVVFGEKVGYVELYYDDDLILDEIKQTEIGVNSELEKFNAQVKQKKETSKQEQINTVFIILLIIISLIAFLSHIFVNNPLSKLKTGLDEFFLFLQNKSKMTQKIELNSSDEFGQMAKSLNENISVSAKLHEQIYELNTNLEKKVEEKTEKVKTLLDNADQGFLSFGADLIVDSEYSQECINIFKDDISGKNIATLLYQEQNKREFFIQTLKSLIKETNKQKVKTIISLLQNEFIINKKAINVKYKMVSDDRFMLIFTDITTRKVLENKINKEKNILKMIVAIVSDSCEFFELYDEFIDFADNVENAIDFEKTPLHNTTELYRQIHTFKGLFSQKEMGFVVKNLHELETKLSNELSNKESSNVELQTLMRESDFKAWLDKDVSIIKDVLGDDLFKNRGKIAVSEDNISQIEQKIIQIADKNNELDEFEDVVTEIKNLKNRTIASMFAGYPKLLDALSAKLEKSIYHLKIVADEDLKVGDDFKPFIKSLIHVFRNSIDHGIESMDRRYEVGKDEIGTISCTISKMDKNLHIVIADDGAGLDIEAITQKANKLGIDTNNLSKKEIYELIFLDSFSTKDKVSKLSGRGVGMAAVKSELEKLNGVIKINTQKDVGTTFEFILPM